MYICRNCNYSTTIKHNFNIHIRGKKHIELEEKILNEKKKKEEELLKKNLSSLSKYICKNCNKKYDYATNLSRHKKTCSQIVNNNIINKLSSIAGATMNLKRATGSFIKF